MTLAIVLVTIACLQQAWWWRREPQPTLVGDENDYVARAHLDDPYQPRMFLRVPMMIYISRRCRGASRAATSRRLRLLNVLIGIVTFGGTLYGAWLAAGGGAMLIAGLAMLWLPERLILNQHIWGDGLLALLTALLTVLFLSQAPALLTAAAAGLLLACAAMTRIEQLALLPAAGAVLAELQPAFIHWLLLIAPSVVALVLWSLRNGVRYGRWIPDDTAAFNLTIMGQELKVRPGQPRSVESLVQKTLRIYRQHRDHWPRAVRAAIKRPLQALHDLLIRTLSMLGSDTFVSQRLLPPVGRAYRSAPGWLYWWLKVSWPLTVGVLVAGLIANPSLPPALLPTLAGFAAFVVIHSRTRYRVACFPGTAIWLGLLWSSIDASDLRRVLLAAAAGTATTALLLALRLRHE